MQQKITNIENLNTGLIENKIDLAQPEFLGFVYTAWHLDNLVVLLKKNNYKAGNIFVVPQDNIKDKSRFRLNEEHFADHFFDSFNIYKLVDSYCKLNYCFFLKRIISLKKLNRKINIIVPGGINLKIISTLPFHKYLVNYYIIDEGTGSYMTPKMFSRAIYRDSKNYSYLKEDIKRFLGAIFKIVLSKIACDKIYKFLLFNKSNNKLLPNIDVCSGLNKLYSEEGVDNSNKTIVFFKDFGVIETKPLLSFYNELFSYLQSKGFNIILKKHPNDKDVVIDKIVENFNQITVLQNNISGEKLVGQLKPKLIIGGFTTAIFTSCSIFQVKTISYMLFYKKYKELSKGHHSIINSFYERFANTNKNLKFVQDIKELFGEIES